MCQCCAYKLVLLPSSGQRKKSAEFFHAPNIINSLTLLYKLQLPIYTSNSEFIRTFLQKMRLMRTIDLQAKRERKKSIKMWSCVIIPYGFLSDYFHITQSYSNTIELEELDIFLGVSGDHNRSKRRVSITVCNQKFTYQLFKVISCPQMA